MERLRLRVAGTIIGTLVLLIATVSSSSGATSSQTQGRTDPRVFAIGDSVMLGAQGCMEKHGYDVDALGSRRVAAVAQELRAKSDLPPQVIVHTGTNGGAHLVDLRAVMRVLGPSHQVIWVTVQLPDNTGRYTFEASTNEAIRSLPRLYANAYVADWNAMANTHPRWTGGDGIHLTRDGCRGYAQVVASEVNQVLLLTEHYVPMRPLLTTATSPSKLEGVPNSAGSAHRKAR